MKRPGSLASAVLLLALALSCCNADETPAPSTQPSGAPTVSSSPTASPAPSQTPTISSAPTKSATPSVQPSGGPTGTPSSAVVESPAPSAVGANGTQAPTIIPGGTAAPTTPTLSTTAPTLAPVVPPASHKKWSFWRFVEKTIAWFMLLVLALLAFGAFMSNRYRIYFFLRGVWYTILRFECTGWILRKLRLSHSYEPVDPGLNTVIFENEMDQGLLMRETDT
mmetsp:Transcript_16225/g.21230  ORF Transcript_16225/g.21230 Transcript_16225/m.21230 type:complete len:223 (+) Transcript_16225:90-758(+)